jgi:hypothetical protein
MLIRFFPVFPSLSSFLVFTLVFFCSGDLTGLILQFLPASDKLLANRCLSVSKIWRDACRSSFAWHSISEEDSIFLAVERFIRHGEENNKAEKKGTSIEISGMCPGNGTQATILSFRIDSSNLSVACSLCIFCQKTQRIKTETLPLQDQQHGPG